MYSPIMWAEPNKLNHLKEKRELERKGHSLIDKPLKKHYNSRFIIFDVFRKPTSYLRMLKISFTP